MSEHLKFWRAVLIMVLVAPVLCVGLVIGVLVVLWMGRGGKDTEFLNRSKPR